MAIGTTKSSKFMDSGLVELNRYVYAVAAVNFHGVEGPAAQKLITTPADTSAPRVVTAQSSTNPTQLSVVFSEPVDPASASEVANYSIDRGISVEKVSFDTERGIATLATSPQEENATYTLTVKRILDRASSPNRINPNNKTLYTYSHIAGLVGYWRFDGEREPLVRDRSGLHNDGHGHRVSWHDNALAFNGKDSYVMIPNSFSLRDVTNKSFTFVATVKPDGFPQSANGYGIFLRTGSHPAYFFGLSYRSDKTFDAQLITSGGDSPIRASSKAVDPGKWYHLPMVVDDATKIMTLYVNGEPVSPTRFTGTLRDLNEEAGGNYIAGEYYIGSTKPDRGTGSFFARHFRGEISEVRLYDRALDSTAVQTLFATNGALRNTKSITN
jgi:hypothetical protein